MSNTPPTSKGMLDGRTILICGVNGGLGEALAHASARAGAQVILLGRRIPRLHKLYDTLEANGAREPAIYPLDLAGATPDHYHTLAETLAQKCGRLDGIVHCAAEFKGLASMENMPLEDWFTGLHVNLTAPWLLTRACMPLLRQSPDASALFVLDHTERTTRAFWGPYGVAKQALRGMIAIWREELANSSVRLQGVLPGPMRTALRGRAYFAEDPGSISLPEAYAHDCIRLLAGQHEDSGSAIVTLAATEPAQPRPLGLATRDA